MTAARDNEIRPYRIPNARVARGAMPGMAPTRKIASPVVTRIATSADRARLTRKEN